MSKIKTTAYTIIFASAIITQASAQSYHFTIDQTNSYLQGNVAGAANLKGSLIGNYNSSTNPTGTRTKPGTSGSFGSTENVAVPVSAKATWTFTVNNSVAGTFDLSFDLTKKKVVLKNYTAKMTQNAIPVESGTFTPLTSAFRTKNPTFAYPAFGTTLTANAFTLSDFQISQTSTQGGGALKLISGSTYAFAATYVATVSATISTHGATKTVTGTMPMLMNGKVTFTSEGAVITLTNGLSSNTLSLKSTYTLPAVDLALPAGSAKAYVIFNSSITSASIAFDHAANVSAYGDIVK